MISIRILSDYLGYSVENTIINYRQEIAREIVDYDQSVVQLLFY